LIVVAAIDEGAIYMLSSRDGISFKQTKIASNFPGAISVNIVHNNNQNFDVMVASFDDNAVRLLSQPDLIFISGFEGSITERSFLE